MGGIHIAEALGIPYFRAFSMPWTRTRASSSRICGTLSTKWVVLTTTLRMSCSTTSFGRRSRVKSIDVRKKELGLQATNLEKMQPNKVPFLYNFSPSVVIPPLDYSDWIRVTGYWFLDEGTSWTPPKELSDFIDKARRDGKKDSVRRIWINRGPGFCSTHEYHHQVRLESRCQMHTLKGMVRSA